MKRTPAKRSSLFLLELIIAILFFSLTSAVCVQFFARAHRISRQTQELNAALEKVSGCTEIFLSGGDFTDIFGDRGQLHPAAGRFRGLHALLRQQLAALHTCGCCLHAADPDTALRPSAAWLLYSFAPEKQHSG